MSRLNFSRWLWVYFPWTSGRGMTLGLLLALAALGLVSDGWYLARRVWHELHRPTAVYRGSISQGIAFSLNSLERQRGTGELLPWLHIRGVLLDDVQNDWVLLGEETSERPGLPLDAIAIALRAVRLHHEAPGIDIRPQHGGGEAPQAVQTVRYLGGLAGTVVGKWFFQFDYWMKRTSLGYEPVALPGLPVYWYRAVEALEREATTRTLSGPTRWTRANRYWLCTGRFVAIEEVNTLTFEHTPLHVLAERVPAAGEAVDKPAFPCASRGTDDPLAAEFAHWLTEHLGEVARVVPVAEIEAFSRLMAGFTWLTQQDPYRDLRPWLHVPLAPADTPTTVPTLTRQATREYPVMQNGSLLRQQYRLELSGGVLIAPELTLSRVRDDSLRLLHRAVLTARPAGKPAVWRFTFRPPSS